MKRLIIVTGSSRGIGEAITHQFNEAFKTSENHFLLLARDLAKLEEVKEKLQSVSSANGNEIFVRPVKVDFGANLEVDDYFVLLKDNLKHLDLNTVDELYVVYNHGTLEFGNVSLVAQSDINNKFQTNLFSVWQLLAAVNLYMPVSMIPKQFHVNISSGYAYEPTANWSGHCCARSSRDMLFRCLALEQPQLRVLNYEPGIVYTDMLKQATEISPEYKEGYDTGKYTKPEDTSRKLINILLEDKFSSGSRLKY